MKSLGLLKPLPHFASVAAVGFAATISPSVLPCFLRAATFLAGANQQVAIKGELGFVSDRRPWPGMTIIVSVTLARFASVARIMPSMLPAGGIVDKTDSSPFPERISDVKRYRRSVK